MFADLVQSILAIISLRDRKRNEWIRRETGMTVVIHRVRSLKWQWAGHVARIEDERWTKRVLAWRSYKHKRSVERWDSDIKRYLSREMYATNQNWQQIANNRHKSEKKIWRKPIFRMEK